MVVFHSIDKFFWDKENSTLSADMSTLDEGGKVKPFHKISNDDYDTAFFIKGKKTSYEFKLEEENSKVAIFKPFKVSCPVKKICVFNK